MKFSAKTIAFATGGLILVLMALVQFFAWQQVRSVVYQSHPASTYTLEEFNLAAEEHLITTEDGLKLAALYIPVEDAKATIVIVHGASDDGGKTVMLPYAKFLADAGYSSVTFGLRNYAGSEGSKTTFAVEEWQDVLAAYRLAERLDSEKPIGILGVSMGAASLLTTMGKMEIGDFAVATVPYTTFASGASWDTQNKLRVPQWSTLPFIELAALIEFGPDYLADQPAHVIANIDVPVLLVSARNDKKVNPQDQYELQRLGGENISIWQSEVAAHDVLNTDGDNYRREVLNFINSQVDHE